MIRTETLEHATVVELARGRGNALDSAFLGEIRETFVALRAQPPRGVILTAQGKIFCAGLDLVALADAEPATLKTLLAELAATLREIFTFPRPVVAAINGHAVAGGALLTLACDMRLMVMGDARWGLTESQLGLVVPASMVELARYSVPRPILEKLLYAGQAYPAFKAREMGVLDDLVEADALLGRAAELIVDRAPVPVAFGEIKQRLRAPALAAMDAAQPLDADFVQAWSTPEVRARVQAAAGRLRNRA